MTTIYINGGRVKKEDLGVFEIKSEVVKKIIARKGGKNERN